mmetsp:Transcript_11600/g.31142  ORF Transcript_11600/g.31142 Transcript_11600/m.31142 type:complete len:86 (+) Transcript_11600:1583-1840(+)
MGENLYVSYMINFCDTLIISCDSPVSAFSLVVLILLTHHHEKTADYRAGKDRMLKFFVGQAMKATKGQANPSMMTEILKQALDDK